MDILLTVRDAWFRGPLDLHTLSRVETALDWRGLKNTYPAGMGKRRMLVWVCANASCLSSLVHRYIRSLKKSNIEKRDHRMHNHKLPQPRYLPSGFVGMFIKKSTPFLI